VRVIAIICAIALCASQPCVAATPVSLPPTAPEQAVDCLGAATVIALKSPHGYSLPAATKSVYYSLLWTVGGKSLSPEGQKEFQDALTAAVQKIVADGNQKDVDQLCTAAYPNAVSDKSVSLPGDSDHQFLLCTFYGGRAAGNYFGIAKKFPLPETQRFMDFVTLLRAHTDTLNAAGKRAHVGTQAQLDSLIAEGFGLGRPDKVLDACIAAFPANSRYFN
jgi:hypothetical protein